MTKTIKFVDQTIRDAQQSLWAFLMSTEMITPIAGVMDEVGYQTVATVGSNGYVVQTRYYGEDPWERLRLLAKAMPKTPLRGSYMTTALASFDIDTPREAIALWIRRSVANGVKEFWICDYQASTEAFNYLAKVAKEEGAQVITSLMYSFSPAHDEAHWAKKTKRIAESRNLVDAIMIEDASGVLTPERTRALVSTVQKHCQGIPLEFHSHCGSGLAPLCYLEAIQAGVQTMHTAVAPLANGPSLPSTESILRNAKRLGYRSDIDEAALAEVSAHFRRLAEREGFAVGLPEEYDLFHYEHQVPGGMLTNLKRQLGEVGMSDRLDEVLEEVVRVRAELGYPVMATPFSQIVGVQAMENVVSGERYKAVADTVVKYVLGFYGEPAAPVDPQVVDRVLSLPEAAKLRDWKPVRRYKTVEELREEVGPELGDDDLLLNLLIPGHSATAGKAKPKRPPRPLAKGGSTVAVPSGLPVALDIEVDGEVFRVKVSSANGAGAAEGVATAGPKTPAQLPEGAVTAGMGGMVVSVKALVGAMVNPGDVLATIEAMKMLREVGAPHAGVVKQICVADGDMVSPQDLLMVVG